MRRLLCFLLVFTLMGCANVKFQMTDGAVSPAANAPKLEEREANFLSGFGAEHQINAVKICGGVDRIESVEVSQTGRDGFIAFITFGLYTPLTARVYCKNK